MRSTSTLPAAASLAGLGIVLRWLWTTRRPGRVPATVDDALTVHRPTGVAVLTALRRFPPITPDEALGVDVVTVDRTPVLEAVQAIWQSTEVTDAIDALLDRHRVPAADRRGGGRGRPTA